MKLTRKIVFIVALILIVANLGLNVIIAASTTITLTSNPTICLNSCDGTATVTATGGIQPYYYAWNTSPVQTDSIATGLCVGTYVVTVSDNNCTASGFELLLNGDFESGNVNFSSSYYFCNTSGCLGPAGGYGVGTDANFYNSGFAGSDHTTGSGNFMVINGSSTANTSVWCQTITVTPNTTYEFSTWVSSVNPTSPAILQFSINGVNLGSTFTASSTVGLWLQFFQTWNSGSDTTATICIVNQNTAGGGNDFGLDDISFQECVPVSPAIDSVVVLEPTAVTATLTGTDALCFASCDGSATATATGGNSSSYTYAWSNSATTSSVSSLCQGIYTVTVTDANGCDTVESITINQPSQLFVTTSGQPATCGQNDGYAYVNSVSGGTGTYTYLWDDPLSQTTDTAFGLFGGMIYNVIVYDANGCSTSIAAPVGNQGGPTIDTVIGNNITCAGDNDGTAVVTANGGTGSYTYVWSNTQATSTATGLSAGTFFVTVKDINGCETVDSIIITEPIALLVDSITGADSACANAPVPISAYTSGGSPLLTYTWDNAVTGSSQTVTTGITSSYTVTVTDGNGCTDTETFDLFIYPSMIISVSGASICEGESTTLSVNVIGGTGGPYIYLWNDGSTTSSINITPNTNTSYSVSVDDGCSNPNTPVNVTVNPKPVADFDYGCAPDSFITKFSDLSTIASGTITSWLWNFDDGFISTEQHPPHDYLSTGQYNVRLVVTSDSGCTHTISLPTYSAPTASFSLYPPEASTANPIIEFTDASSSDVNSWYWNFGDGDDLLSISPNNTNPLTHSYDESGIYAVMLTVKNTDGCVDTALNYVQIISDYLLFVPNSFSPNGDGVNDYFMPKGVGIDGEDFELLIYNRWGDQIAKVEGIFSNDPVIGWDGIANKRKKTAQQDVYVWSVKTIDPAGKKHRYIGHVTLIK